MLTLFTQVVALEYIHTILNATQNMFLFVSFICNRRVLYMYIKKLSGVKATFSEALSRRQKHSTVKINTFQFRTNHVILSLIQWF